MESRQRYTLVDVYNAAKYEKNFNYSFWIHITLDIIGENAMRFAGYSLVLVATGLIAIISILGFFIVLPSLFEWGSMAMTVNILWGLLLVFSIYFHYFMAVFTKPGSPKDGILNTVGSSSNGLICDDPEAQNESHYRLCKRCNYIKPRRTHHCSICNSCVLKMDHHCPWVSNCVGYRNYRYFASFLFWVTVATAYVSIISGVSLFQRGSMLFPDDGRTPFQAAVNVFFGTSEQNIYLQLYELLSNSDINKNKHVMRRGKRGHRHGVKETSGGLAPHLVNDPTHTNIGTNTDADVDANASRHGVRQLLGDRYIKLADLYHSDGTGSAVISDEINHMYITFPPPRLEPCIEAEGKQTRKGNTRKLKEEGKEEEDVSHLNSALKTHKLHKMNVIDGPGSISIINTLLWMAPHNLLVFIAFMLAIGVCIGAGSLLCFHIFLIRNGYTTIEFFESDLIAKQCKQAGVRYKHPFDRGISANFAEVFGDLPLILALLPSMRAPPVVSFPPEEVDMYGEICASPISQRSSEDKIGNGVTTNNEGASAVARRPLWENNNSSGSSSGSGNKDQEQSKQQFQQGAVDGWGKTE